MSLRHTDNPLTDLLATLADPVRLAMLGLLLDGPRNGAQVARELQVSVPVAHRNLYRLVEAGLVKVAPVANAKLFEIAAGAVERYTSPSRLLVKAAGHQVLLQSDSKTS